MQTARMRKKRIPKGSDTAQWMGQVETDETKLQDNQLEYSELYTLISRYNPTIEQSLTSFNQSLEDYVNAWDELKFGQSSASTDLQTAKKGWRYGKLCLLQPGKSSLQSCIQHV